MASGYEDCLPIGRIGYLHVVSEQLRIGRCSECGGDVMAHHGAWYSVSPPPPPTCSSCGAVEAAADPVIPMRPRRPAIGSVGVTKDGFMVNGVLTHRSPSVVRDAQAGDWWPNGLPQTTGYLVVTP